MRLIIFGVEFKAQPFLQTVPFYTACNCTFHAYTYYIIVSLSLSKSLSLLQVVTVMQLYNPIFVITSVLKLSVIVICRACGSAEYEINRQCCPMCSEGHRVYKHCTEDISTTCIPCVQSTYTDAPNGLIKCLPCTVCDEGIGLRIKEKCRSYADTLCEPLSGYYCEETQHKSCTKARQHSTCLPGKYINQTGTAFTDTLCEDCSDGTYSDGSYTFCKPHTKCESVGQVTARQGTKSSDSECIQGHFYYLFLGILPILVILGGILCLRKKMTTKCTNVNL
ncbi:hypothetical protein NFI96_011964 [Prochilodus magdalenae]|nr:hypothetical protein NFI96_011964 [Prochilodus magdalenae]